MSLLPSYPTAASKACPILDGASSRARSRSGFAVPAYTRKRDPNIRHMGHFSCCENRSSCSKYGRRHQRTVAPATCKKVEWISGLRSKFETYKQGRRNYQEFWRPPGVIVRPGNGPFFRRSISHRAEENGRLSSRLGAVLGPTAVAGEAYSKLGTNLLQSKVDGPPKVIVSTSPGPDEGNSTPHTPLLQTDRSQRRGSSPR
jgi:hypothetical protein